MSELNESMVAAWREAAMDIGIRVTAPYRLEFGGSKSPLCEAYIPDFGSRQGAFVLSSRSRRKVRDLLSDHGRWSPELGDGYARYRRKAWIEMLDDWGWFGEADLKPDWYSGNYWS